MKVQLLFICTALLLTLSFCKKSDPEAGPITQNVSGSEATIAWQDCAFFTDHDITICFTGANEYRCACDVYCIWEGAVDATLHITNTTGLDTTIVLTTNSSPQNLPSEATIAGKVIRFVGTSPDLDFCNDYGEYEKYKVVIQVE
jgi:hypothetical protein